MKGQTAWNKGIKNPNAYLNFGKYAEKGIVPWNKGTKGTMKVNKASFKKGVRSWSKDNKDLMPKGNNVKNWRGDDVEYSALHHWVNRWLGKIKECVYCGEDEKRIEWASIGHKAKRDLNDYIPLCVKCHRNYDKKGGDQLWQE